MHAGDHGPARSQNARTPAPGRRAAPPRRSRPGRRADVLHAEVVLVGEEVRQRVVRLVLAQQVAGGGLALLDRGVPVLDPDPPAEQRVVVVGDVAGGEDVAGRSVRRRASTRMPLSTSSPAALGERRRRG